MKPEIHKVMQTMADRACEARRAAEIRPAEDRTRAIETAAEAMHDQSGTILAANAEDLARARERGRPAAFIDRLELNQARLDGVIAGIRAIALQPDPLGEAIEQWSAPSGVDIRQTRIPIGVLAVIFESRPNVAADAAALAIRSGNAVILRGGSDSQASSLAIVSAIRDGLAAADMPVDLVQHPETTDRDVVGALLSGLNDRIDLVVPRGGRDLVARVQAEARVAVLGHLDGVCHGYVHASADAEMARTIIRNSKMRRTGVCNALECLLVDRDCLDTVWPQIARDLSADGCELRADEAAREAWPQAHAASNDDWGREYLDAILAVRTVDGLDSALDHINRYGSGHTDLIIASDEAAIRSFQGRVDSAVVLANASTGFSDGAEFGFGGEIGIATSRLHARGPVGARQLTTFKYLVSGTGQIRG
ncbi:glutamate-5-semialdehyde dehydrogenase [Maricaulis sp.]|uniref:glutamate-5-semialdehyde dehydrogenase n=1 Tax=Maricaulis sp. TaxID=1486257 RepID=UPI002608FCC0|nr:glutamate-5-semialdehyde dehydrogenase [Maricaulis sp.]